MPKSFNTLKEIFDYIPKCFICDKKLICKLDTRDKVIFKSFIFNLILKDDQIISTNKKEEKIIISLDNEIIQGKQRIKNVGFDLTLIKACRTCNFNIFFSQRKDKTFVYNNLFPQMNLAYITLQYTAKNNKRIYYSQDYRDHIENNTIKPSSVILLDGINLPSVNFDFEKINNLKDLNKKINMIKIFQ